MLTKFATTLIAGCALIGQAHAFDFNADQATRLFALAEMADQNCPGMKLNFDKVGKIFRQAGVKADVLDSQIPAIQTEWKSKIGTDREQLCEYARDSSMPFHLMLDID